MSCRHRSDYKVLLSRNGLVLEEHQLGWATQLFVTVTRPIKGPVPQRAARYPGSRYSLNAFVFITKILQLNGKSVMPPCSRMGKVTILKALSVSAPNLDDRTVCVWLCELIYSQAIIRALSCGPRYSFFFTLSVHITLGGSRFREHPCPPKTIGSQRQRNNIRNS